MFETTIDDGSQDFRLQQEVAEAGAVDGDVSSLDVLLLVAGLSHNLIGLFLVFVVEKIVVIGHNCSGFGFFRAAIESEKRKF